MRLFVAISVVLGVASALPQPKPQDVSAADILNGAKQASRYGQDSGAEDQSLLEELFGTGGGNAQVDPNVNGDYHAPEKQTVDTQSDDCRYYQSQGFQCVPYLQCDEWGEIITDGGSGLFNIRGNFGSVVQLDPENSKCRGNLEVCCRHPKFTDKVTARPTTATTTPKPVTTQPPPPRYTSQCGRRNPYGIGVRIQNEEYAASTQFGEWPHMCALLEKKDGKNLYVCGASLIAPGVVMTAAHCVDKLTYSDLKVRCGEWDTQQTVEPIKHQDRDVKSMIVHPGFSQRNLTNDIAILKTTEDFILSAHIDTICLPDIHKLHASFEWDKCVATGWGKDKFDVSGEYQVILKQVELNLVDKHDCQNKLRQTRLGVNFELDDTFICAGGKEKVDTCKGDGGGPLVCPTGNSHNPTYVQAGIVAWGVGCGEEGVPGVYADVVDQICFIEWSQRCMSERNDCGTPECFGWAERQEKKVMQAAEGWKKTMDSLEQGTKPFKRARRKHQAHIRAAEVWHRAIDQCDTYKNAYGTSEYSDDLCKSQFDEDDDYYYDYSNLEGYQRTNLKGVDTRTTDVGEGETEEAEDGEDDSPQ